MYPSQHAALTALACLPLKLCGWSLPELAAFSAGATLIDVDHYLAYAITHHDWSLPHAYRWHVQRVPPKAHSRPHLYLPPLAFDRFRPFHGVTPIVIAALLTRLPARSTHHPAVRLFLALVRATAWGVLFHRLCDYSVEVFEDRPGIPRNIPKDSPKVPTGEPGPAEPD